MNIKSVLSIVNVLRKYNIGFDDIVNLIDLAKVISARVKEEKAEDDNTPGKLTLVEIDEIAAEAIQIAVDRGIVPDKYADEAKLVIGVLVAIEQILGGDED